MTLVYKTIHEVLGTRVLYNKASNADINIINTRVSGYYIPLEILGISILHKEIAFADKGSSLTILKRQRYEQIKK